MNGMHSNRDRTDEIQSGSAPDTPGNALESHAALDRDSSEVII